MKESIEEKYEKLKEEYNRLLEAYNEVCAINDSLMQTNTYNEPRYHATDPMENRRNANIGKSINGYVDYESEENNFNIFQ